MTMGLTTHWAASTSPATRCRSGPTRTRRSRPTPRRSSRSPTPQARAAPRSACSATASACPRGQWMRVRLPFASFVGLFSRRATSRFDPARLASITIVQGLDDGARAHAVCWTTCGSATRRGAATRPRRPRRRDVGRARLRSPRRAQRGRASAEPDLLHYTIYRSIDGGTFVPIGIQKAARSRATPTSSARRAERPPTGSPPSTPATTSRRTSAPVPASTRAMTDDELLTMVQEASFRYYWDAAHPVAGMAIEILPGDDNLVALGASGFGIMALVVGRRARVRHARAGRRAAAEDPALPREGRSLPRRVAALPRRQDRAGRSRTSASTTTAADLVETAFLMQGLLVGAAVLRPRHGGGARDPRHGHRVLARGRVGAGSARRRTASSSTGTGRRTTASTSRIRSIGWNETMIVYLLAIASPTHAVPAVHVSHRLGGAVGPARCEYRRGWSRTTDGDHYVNGNTYYGIKLDVGVGSGGELFFTHFSFLGFDPREKRDATRTTSRTTATSRCIHHAYCGREPAEARRLRRRTPGADRRA